MNNGGCNTSVRFGVHVLGYTKAYSLPSSAVPMVLCWRVSVRAVVLCKTHVLPQRNCQSNARTFMDSCRHKFSIYPG